jgi:hypothetical protein
VKNRTGTYVMQREGAHAPHPPDPPLSVVYRFIRPVVQLDRALGGGASTGKFLRAPGQSLVEKLDDINDDLVACMAMLIAMPILFYAFYISDLYFQRRPLSLNLALVYIVIGIL